MADQPSTVGSAASRTTDAPEMPPVVDRATFQAQLDRLRAREKAHTHESDAIAAARRRLPMVEMEPSTPLIGPQGPVTLPETFEGRRHLIAYYFMWHSGHPAAGQCEGCTWVTTQVADLSYLHSRDMVPAIDTPSLAVGALRPSRSTCADLGIESFRRRAQSSRHRPTEPRSSRRSPP